MMHCYFFNIYFQILFQVLSSGSFELRIKSFTNSLGRLHSGQCCDDSSNMLRDAPCLSPCRTKFRVCLKIYQANIDTTSPCTFGDITTPVLGGNSLDVPNLNVEGFSNPIVFPFDFTWPVSEEHTHSFARTRESHTLTHFKNMLQIAQQN